MKMIKWIFFSAVLGFFLESCEKDRSLETGLLSSDPSLIGNDCRISKISYADSATSIPLGSIAATINSSDNVTDITKFDSLGMVIDFDVVPVYSGDTVFINSREFFIRNSITGQVKTFRGATDPTDPTSATFDVLYSYNADNNLVNKSFSYTLTPATIYKDVTYTYTGANLTHMVATDLTTGDITADADISYYSNISAKNYLYLFPDEKEYAAYGQFFNFGKRPKNAVKTISLQYYDTGVPVGSLTTSFLDYNISPDGYVVQVTMSGNDQPSLPVQHGRLKFSYFCR